MANKKVKEERLFTGALDDNRSPEDKAKDYLAVELATATKVEWIEKDPSQWAKYPVRDQDGSGSCVAQTLALMLGIENKIEEGRFIELSASDIYQRRANRPGAGMIGNDAMQIGKTFGATLEDFMPSQNMDEQVIHEVPRAISDTQVGPVFKSGGYVQLPFNIDYIASMIEAGKRNGVPKPIMTWYRFNRKEWTEEPKVLNTTPDVHHSVTAIDYALYKGRKVLVTQDSWGLHSTTRGGIRLIGEDFIKNRMTYCAMLMELRNDWRDEQATPPTPVDPTRPRHRFAETLEFGLMGNNDVVALQNILKFEGIFPTTVQSTGNYLQVTAKSVYNWQVKHNVASMAELDALQGRVVGPKTIKKLNELYA